MALAVLVGIAGFASNTRAQASYQVVAAFDRPYSLGANPFGGVIQGSDGCIYGTTVNQGTAGFGTIYKIDPAGTPTVLHSFHGSDGAHPDGGLIQGSDGSFYGTTNSGGAGGGGTVFKIDTRGTLTTLHSFNGAGGDGAGPEGGLIRGFDASFYGTTGAGGTAGWGTIFKIDAAGTLTTLHSFNVADGAAHPSGGLVQGNDGSVYGTTMGGGANGYGTIFKMDAAGTLTTFHSFNYSDGSGPHGRLTRGSDGSFYGTTSDGGAAGYGTVFKIDTAGIMTLLHSFLSSDGHYPRGGLIEWSDGSFYGTTSAGGPDRPDGNGTIFRIDRTGTLTTLHNFSGSDGADPEAELIDGGDGFFYGTTFSGGGGGGGLVFKMDTAGRVTPVLSFSALEPRFPAGLIQASDGSLLGTTSEGGAANRGTVFKIDATGALTILHSFASGEGANPQARLVQASDGSFYGTTPAGSATGWYGTIFKIDTGGTLTTLTTLHSFNQSDGGYPNNAGLIQGSDGSFYGTTQSGGAAGIGTVFKVDAAGTLTTLHGFTGSDGASPSGGLTQGSDGSFYGTTRSGGTAGYGTVFRIDAAGTLTTLKSFLSSESLSGEGYYPQAPLIQASDGVFYGTTTNGGLGYGTIFKIDAAGTLTTLHSFNHNDGSAPLGGLIQGSDGSFYGTTLFGGASGWGTIFKIDAAGTLRTLHSFNNDDGARPSGGVIQGSDGSFYGTTQNGGNGSGVVFRLTVQTPTITTLIVSPSPSMIGQSVTLTANVTADSGTPNGSVQFYDGSVYIGAATLNGGTAALHTSTLTSGSHALRAEYAGADGFAPSASPAVTHIVTLYATFINPANHATNVDLTQPITWTTVSGAEAYYLYLGTAFGTKDVVNTGDLHTTSYQVVTAPSGGTLYARLWTRVAGVWRFVDMSFTAAPGTGLCFTYPAAGVTSADLRQPFQWAPVVNAQAYFLYLGTALGQKDLVSTGELQATSSLATNLPLNQPLYLRLWVKVANAWSHIDRTITATATTPIAQFITPTNGATNVNLAQAIQWTTVTNAQAYYLYVGSSLGAKNLLNSGELTGTSYVASTLPAGQLLYARLWTKVADAWRYVDSTFTAASAP